MSCNYADGLSPYDNKGKLGLPEIKEDINVITEKAQLLAQWIKEAKHVVFHTGAGISTAAGIPDFRGPNGVWTLERKGLKPDINTSFDKAEPTKTHMILRTLIEQGYAKFIISQNIDGLHLKSGIKRTHLAELHGNMFVARCAFCDKFTILSHCAATVGEKPIGVDCPYQKSGGRACRGKLHDTLLDWEANLPPNELDCADHHSTLADLSICLGTTLQIVPAGNLPLRAKKNPNGRLVIVNLQNTKHDKKANLIINAKVDTVMEKVAEHLGLTPIKYSVEIDPTKLWQNSSGSRTNAVLDWTIPASAIRQLKSQVKNMPKKEVQKRPRAVKKRQRSESPPKYPILEERKPTKLLKISPKTEPIDTPEPATGAPETDIKTPNACRYCATENPDFDPKGDSCLVITVETDEVKTVLNEVISCVINAEPDLEPSGSEPTI